MKSHFPKEYNGLELSKLKARSIPAFAKLCKETAKEGHVLLKNDGVLPFSLGEKIAVFGRSQEEYNRMGSGSGGDVTPPYLTDIVGSLKKAKTIIDSELEEKYKAWTKAYKESEVNTWQIRTAREEMPLDDNTVKEAAKRNDCALIIIARYCGESVDLPAGEAGFGLTAGEEAMLEAVTRNFKRTAVFLNVASIIDVNAIMKYNPGAVMIGWTCGMEGGAAAADVLTGVCSPSGHLVDTVATSIDKYPSTANIMDKTENVYKEDIYVGYRYFETFAKEDVVFPFGYGLSYTTFEMKNVSTVRKKGGFDFTVNIKNTGTCSGKGVVQIYVEAPDGELDKPSRVLVGFAKTRTLRAGASQDLTVFVSDYSMSSYNDKSESEYRYCYLLEKGVYRLYLGENVRDAKEFFSFEKRKTEIIDKLESAIAPSAEFEIMTKGRDGKLTYTPASRITYDLEKRIKERLPVCPDYTGDKGYKLKDVYEKRITLDDFIAQLSLEDLGSLVYGEGMASPKVFVDNVGVFGGVTKRLYDFGIPLVVTDDGPTGIRDVLHHITSTLMPSGTALACSFNTEIAEKLYEYEAMEMYAYGVDTLLGPGMNIHRSPLCGRNFEYYSEDPFVSGKMAAAVVRGMGRVGKSMTVKHFFGNNQEFGRNGVNDVISERAIREIYLKGFEIAVREGKPDALMTAYNKVNGTYCANNYDLLTTVLRGEWGYKGLVMTDWWTVNRPAAMVRAQNDLWMVTNDALHANPNVNEDVKENRVSRAEYVRSAKTILAYTMRTQSFENYLMGKIYNPYNFFTGEEELITYTTVENPQNREKYTYTVPRDNYYLVRLTYSATFGGMEQRMGRVWTNPIRAKVMYNNPGDGKEGVMEVLTTVLAKDAFVSCEFDDETTIKKIEVLGK